MIFVQQQQSREFPGLPTKQPACQQDCTNWQQGYADDDDDDDNDDDNDADDDNDPALKKDFQPNFMIRPLMFLQPGDRQAWEVGLLPE